MKLKMYSIYDTVAEVFNKPFCDHNDQSAVRAFTHSLLAKETPDKNDFQLYRIGSFDDSNGEIEHENPSRVMSGLDIKEEAA
jgi:hypothetical protein